MPADPSSVSPSEREIEAVGDVIYTETGRAVDTATLRKALANLDRVRDARGDDEADQLDDDVRYERDRAERLEEQLAEARAMCDHNQRVAEEQQQRADDLADRLEMAARSPQGEDHEVDHAQALAEDVAGIHTPGESEDER